MKFQYEDGRLSSSDYAYPFQLIKVLVDKNFVLEKSEKKEAGTKIFIEDMTKLMGGRRDGGLHPEGRQQEFPGPQGRPRRQVRGLQGHVPLRDEGGC